MSAPTPETNQRSNRHRVRQALQRQILAGELQPGNRLRQADLAKQFGVAQTVVRESLLELQFSGLVTAVDNLGVFVSELDAGMLLAAYEIREVFDGLAARLCCERSSRLDIQRLRDIAERIWQFGKENQPVKMGQLDREFHHRIIQISGNPILERLTDGYRSLGMIVRAHRNIDDVRAEHLAIVEAIEAGKGDKAESLARNHVRQARVALQQQVESGSFKPAWVVEDAPEA